MRSTAVAALLALGACGGGKPAAQGNLAPPEAFPPCGDGLAKATGCFIEVPRTTAWIGAQATDPSAPGYDRHARPDEAPAREVTVGPLWMQTTEVPRYRLDECVAAGWCRPRASGAGLVGEGADAASLPARGLSWEEAGELCAWFGGRLPSEAEWEVVARAGRGWRFPWGDIPRCPRRAQSAIDASNVKQARLRACGPAAAEAVPHLDIPTLERLGEAAAMFTDDAWASLCARLPPLPPAERARLLVDEGDRLLQARVASHDLPSCVLDPISEVAMGAATDHPWLMLAMADNVSEWTADRRPELDDGGPMYAVRGMSALSTDPVDMRNAARGAARGDLHLPDLGVRCVRDTPPPTR